MSNDRFEDVKIKIEPHTVEINGLLTRYLVAGSGAPVVLLHGNEDSAIVWRPVMEILAGRYRVYAPDLPGFGASEPPADYAPASYARFISAFLDTLGIERAALVGSSFGGVIALHLARAAAQRVTALVLVSSAGLGRMINLGWPPPVLPGYGELAITWHKTPLGAAVRAWSRAAHLLVRPYRASTDWLWEQYQFAQRPGVLDSALAVARVQADLLGQREVLLDELPQLTVPTLVIWGALDRIVPLLQGWIALQRLTQGSLLVFPDCGHLPYAEQPARFATALDKFLASPDPPRASPAIA